MLNTYVRNRTTETHAVKQRNTKLLSKENLGSLYDDEQILQTPELDRAIQHLDDINLLGTPTINKTIQSFLESQDSQ